MPKVRRRKYSRRLKSLRGILEKLERRLGSDSEESSESFTSDESDSDSGSPGEEQEPHEFPLPEPSAITSVPGPSVTVHNQQFLSMLGENPNQPNRFGPNIHEELESRWTVYLREGLSAERRKDLLSKYLLPENCKALNPPQLNDEIRCLLPTHALKNDHFLSGLQEQLGAGMAILGSILSQKLNTPESELILTNEAVEKLAEAGQLFASVHQAVSSKRKFEINPFLDTDCRSAAVKACIDDYLFGSDFLTKVKTNREMKKAADEIKKPERSTFTSSAGPSGTQSLNSRRPFHRFKIKEDQKVKRRKEPYTKRIPRDTHQYKKKTTEKRKFAPRSYRS
ncbi:unnamed protein product [Callosobruchus maculatus]|uniref:Uncharacterized protein n=1 Tax=Callosobruchus maculatus TaxID=64391 RepID=A0A653CCG4_CALMS|nr:unnamed protein product [Callosobruchus maculatus]